MFNKKTITTIVTSIAIVAAMVAPGMAFAHDGDDDNDNNRHGQVRAENRFVNDDDEDKDRKERQNVNEFGVKVFDNEGKRHGWGLMPHLFVAGVVTAKSGDNLTVDTKGDTDITIDTSDAKIIEVPHKVVAIGDIEVGDKVSATGSRSGNTLNADVIYTVPANLKPAVAKGTVTATTSDSITVQNKNGQTATVNTNSDTEVVTQDGEAATLADIDTDSKVKVFGFWDSVLNVLTAVKIKLWS